MGRKVAIYDCTLREGVQGAGTSFTVNDKIRLVELLDQLGVSFIEAGNPGSNPKDVEFYSRMKGKQLHHAKLVAFGATCRKGREAGKDANLNALLDAGTEYVCIFGKSWDLHVRDVLNCTLEENLAMIRDSIRFLRENGRKVIYDAEHFFDGYLHNQAYAMETIRTAKEAGAEAICLCDTNGACFPSRIREIVAAVEGELGGAVGVHCHNDVGMAVAGTVAAVEGGASIAQTTIFGWGERCGNADTWVVIPNLQLKLGCQCIPENKMRDLTKTSRKASQIANAKHYPNTPYVGRNAFSHKAGMHIAGVNKNAASFEHIEPGCVGNERHFLMSEIAGRSAILEKVRQILPAFDVDSAEAAEIIEKIKALEFEGFQFEGADASFELLVRKILGIFQPHFTLESFSAMSLAGQSASAMINIRVDGKSEVTASAGYGPVDALDKAARKALERFYPCITKMYLSDYKVRVLDSRYATASKVRVVIESSDGNSTWTTVGVSADIIDASWQALMDALEYMLIHEIDEKTG